MSAVCPERADGCWPAVFLPPWCLSSFEAIARAGESGVAKLEERISDGRGCGWNGTYRIPCVSGHS